MIKCIERNKVELTKENVKGYINVKGFLKTTFKELKLPPDIDEKDYPKFLYNFLHNTPQKVCIVCEKPIPFINFKKGYFSNNFCSKTCHNKHHKVTSEYKLKKYTVEEKGLGFFEPLGRRKMLKYPEPFTSSSEYYYCLKNNIGKPTCPVCGEYTVFLDGGVGYSKTCSPKCAGQLPEVLEKRKETNRKKYGYDIVTQNPQIQRKRITTNREKFGSVNNYEKIKQTCIEKYWVDNTFDTGDRIEQQIKRVKSIRENSTEPNSWVKVPDNINYNLEKRIEINKIRYGVDHWVQSDEYKQKSKQISIKRWETKKENGTTNTSKLEDGIFKELKQIFPAFTILREYSSSEYPFNCDFFIEELKLYIEVQGFFTHGYKSFEGNKDDIILLDKWKEKSKSSTFYKNAIRVWSIIDVKKREHASRHKLNFLEIFDPVNIKQQIDWVLNGLCLNYSGEEMKLEAQRIKKLKGSLESRPTHNKMVKTFQPHIFDEENKIYKDPIKRRKLIQNRMKYLGKKEHELTTRELLSGFKISGLYQGFSFFSPLWFKYFIENENIRDVYDPFGGWGHRLLGVLGTKLDTYIYNDLSERTFEGVKKIHDFIKPETKCFFYNNDSTEFIPYNYFDSIFTCPPYNDIEDYGSDTSFKSIMNCLVSLYKKENVKVMGIVIREDLVGLLEIGEADEKFKVNGAISHFKTKRKNEYLYIWRKK